MIVLYVLDTDHLTLLQRNHPTVIARVTALSPEVISATVVSAMEQVRGRLAQIHRAKTAAEVVRAFARLRQMLASHEDLARKLEALEKKFEKHDIQFRVVFDAIRQLMAPPPVKRRSIGFHTAEEKER